MGPCHDKAPPPGVRIVRQRLRALHHPYKVCLNTGLLRRGIHVILLWPEHAGDTDKICFLLSLPFEGLVS